MGSRCTSSTALCSSMLKLSQITSFLQVLLMEGKFGWSSHEREGAQKKKHALYGNTGHKKEVRDLIKVRRDFQ